MSISYQVFSPGKGPPVAPANFLGWQPAGPGVAPIELWDLTEDIPDHPRHSTVSRATLERAGYWVPPALKSPETAHAEHQLRRLLGDVLTALLVAGWSDEVLVERVRAEAVRHGPAGGPTRDGRLRAAVIALRAALTRQRAIDELSPAAREVEQRSIDKIYASSAKEI